MGASLRAGPRTKAKINFSETERLVQLDRGEVMLHVAKDGTRPFYNSADAVPDRRRVAASTEQDLLSVDYDGCTTECTHHYERIRAPEPDADLGAGLSHRVGVSSSADSEDVRHCANRPLHDA